MQDIDYPYISIIVPAYNAENTISRCIDSCINQSYPKDKYEIIVVDNNSTDNTATILNNYNIIYRKEVSIKSSYAARNTGIKHARGDIIAFTDSDCIADNNWISSAVIEFNSDSIGCVAGKIIGHHYNTSVQEYLVKDNCLSQEHTLNHYFMPYPQTANALYRKDVLDKIGIFETWKSGGDADLAWRMQLTTQYHIKYVQSSIIYHIHRSNFRSFFNQQKTWGYGSVLLHKKWRHIINKRSISNIYNEYVIIAKRYIHILLMLRQIGLHLHSNNYYMDTSKLLAYKLGQLEATFIERYCHF